MRLTPVASAGAAGELLLAGDGAEPFARTPELEPHHRYEWRVRVRDEAGQWSEWSDAASIETGPFAYEQWNAQWVSQPALVTRRVEFDLPATPVRARVRFAAQGLARIGVNGVAVNAQATDPSRTDPVRAIYRCYDVTDLLRLGDNTWDITLAGGDWGHAGNDPRVLAELVVETDDGESRTWSPLDARLEAPSEVVLAEPFYVERHDVIQPRRFATIAAPTPVAAACCPGSRLEAPSDVYADDSEPIRNVTALKPVEVDRMERVRIFDVGTNIAGRVELTVGTVGCAGAIRLVHGEHLGPDGRVDTTSLTLPTDSDRVRQATEFMLSGDAGQVCTPWFSYHGFRYFEIEGLDDSVEVSVRAWTHHTDLRVTTSLQTNSSLIDRLLQRAERTLLNNVHGIPEDCPTREQAGWTGDTASVTEMELSLFDMEAFFRKWLGDLSTSQFDNGAIPAISPRHSDHDTDPDPVWGAALQRVLIGHWLHYGDREVVDETLPALRRWADYQLSCRGADGVISESPISYGHDWLALQQTPPPLHHTSATIDCLTVLAELEAVMGDAAAASLRLEQADSLRSAGRALFLDEVTGAFANGSQGALAIGLESGILTGKAADVAIEALVRDIRERGDRVSSGFATTRTVVRALAHRGRSDSIMATLAQPSEPGIGAMLDHGPGTFWECWWIDPRNTGTGSLDHVGLGGPFAGWALQHLAGVRPTGPGFSRFVVEPAFVAGIDRLRLETHTIRGRVVVEWTCRGDRVHLDVEVPVGSEATIVVSGIEPTVVGAGHHELTATVSKTASREADYARNSAGSRVDPIASTLGGYRSLSPGSVDVTGGAEWLGAAVAAGAITGLDAAIQVLPDGISCMPIPHEQLSGPVVRVVGTDFLDDRAPRVRVELGATADLTDARFARAMVDLCLANTSRPIALVLELFGADGTSAQGTARIWPAGWNRVSVDLGNWPGRSAVVAAEVGLEYAADDSDQLPSGPDPVARIPAAFQLGALGFSTARRNW